MEIKPVKTDADFREALREIDSLWNAPMDSPEGDRLELLVALVEIYEAKHYPMPHLDPIEAIHAHMQWNDYTVDDLANVLGSPSRASEILDRKRPLTLEIVHVLNDKWGIPAELLVKPYELAAA